VHGIIGFQTGGDPVRGTFRSGVGALALGLLIGCADTAQEDTDAIETPPAAETDPADADATMDEVSVGDIMADPASFAGRTVTVIADVEEVFGPNAFALDEDDLVEGGIDNDLMVVSRQAGNLESIDDQWLNNKVRVTGTVGTWTLVELEREVGWDLEPELESEVEERGAVLIATSVERVEG
jgi:hypothetical protein